MFGAAGTAGYACLDVALQARLQSIEMDFTLSVDLDICDGAEGVEVVAQVSI